jgi:hypothetical protein
LMGKTFKVGSKTEPEQYPSTDLLTCAITAEQARFDYIVDCLPAS